MYQCNTENAALGTYFFIHSFIPDLLSKQWLIIEHVLDSGISAYETQMNKTDTILEDLNPVRMIDGKTHSQENIKHFTKEIGMWLQWGWVAWVA